MHLREAFLLHCVSSIHLVIYSLSTVFAASFARRFKTPGLTSRWCPWCLQLPINTDHSFIFTLSPKLRGHIARTMTHRQTARGPDSGPGSHSLSRSALIAQRAAHGLPADKWADKPSPRYSFPSWGRYGKREKIGALEREEEKEEEKMNWLCSRAIFSKPVMCSISLRGYKREKRAEGD